MAEMFNYQVYCYLRRFFCLDDLLFALRVLKLFVRAQTPSDHDKCEHGSTDDKQKLNVRTTLSDSRLTLGMT